MTEKPETKLFTVKLTKAERERLEAHRARLGLRSQTDVIRHWINSTTNSRVDELVAAAEASIAAGRDSPIAARSSSPTVRADAISDRASRATAADGVQFGPVARKPGSLLKGPRK